MLAVLWMDNVAHNRPGNGDGNGGERGRKVMGREFPVPQSRDSNGSAGHGSRVKWVNKSEWVTWVSTRDPLTHDQVDKIPRTADLRHSLSHNASLIRLFLCGVFVAVMMFDFESTST